MKKTFLNLRQMGFVLVAATSMLAFSCGGGEDDAETTEADATEETTETTEESCDEDACEDDMCDGDSCEGDSTDEASCDGDMEESCEGE